MVEILAKDNIEDIFENIKDYVDETKELPKTSAINEFQYQEYFENLRKKYDAVIHITLSGKITSSVEHAFNAAKNVKDVYVVDSCSLSTGIALLAIYARSLANKDMDVKEIVERLNKRKKSLQVSFVVNTLNYLLIKVYYF